MHERFSDRARQAMAFANQEAIRLHHDYLSPAHIFLGILSLPSSVATLVLRNLDVDLDTFRGEISKKLEPGNKTLQQTKMAQSEDTRQVIGFAIEEARKLGHKYIGTEHLLLGCLREGHNLAAQILTDRKLRIEQIREEILTLLRSSKDEDHAGTALGHDPMEWVHQQELAKAFRSPKFWHRLIMAVDSANRHGQGEVGDEHLLMAILRDDNSFVSQMLRERGVTADWVRDRLTRSAAI